MFARSLLIHFSGFGDKWIGCETVSVKMASKPRLSMRKLMEGIIYLMAITDGV